MEEAEFENEEMNWVMESANRMLGESSSQKPIYSGQDKG